MENIQQVCIEMLSQRGYEIIDEYEDRIIGQNNGEKICVFLSIIQKLNVDRVGEIIQELNNIDINHCICIYSNTITPVGKITIKKLENIIIETFYIDELQINITKHNFVPLHEKISDEEALIFRKKYGNKFPKMKLNSPISKFYFYKANDIIRIYRKDGTIIYRIVTE